MERDLRHYPNRNPDGNDPLYVPRTGGRERCRPPHRHFFFWRRFIRAFDLQETVRRRERSGHLLRTVERLPAAVGPLRPRSPAGVGAGGAEISSESTPP